MVETAAAAQVEAKAAGVKDPEAMDFRRAVAAAGAAVETKEALGAAAAAWVMVALAVAKVTPHTAAPLACTVCTLCPRERSR